MDEPRRILNGRLWRVQVDTSARLMMIIRTSEAFTSIEEIKRTCAEVVEALDRGGRGGPLLVDLRAARGRNDEPFEAAMRSFRPRFFAGYDPIGIFVRSVVGTLQVQRHLREDGSTSVVSSDLGALLEILGVARVPVGLEGVGDGPG